MESTGSNSFKGCRSRTLRPLSEALDKRLSSYAVAASAAGVGRRARSAEAAQAIARAAGAVGAGLLLSAGPASARIVYTPAYVALSFFEPRNPFPLDLNHDGITDFKIYRAYCDFSSCRRLLVSPAEAGNGVLGRIQGVLTEWGDPFTCRAASALPAGHRIGPGSKFGMYQTMAYGGFSLPSRGPNFSLTCGYWGGLGGVKVQGRFLGLEFTAQGQKHFGWARLEPNANSTLGALTGYAYETDPDTPIRAGDTGPVADARVPEMHNAPPAVATLRPATLGLLALGSTGLDIWRKEL
jgi:hypothetical protein